MSFASSNGAPCKTIGPFDTRTSITRFSPITARYRGPKTKCWCAPGWMEPCICSSRIRRWISHPFPQKTWRNPSIRNRRHANPQVPHLRNRLKPHGGKTAYSCWRILKLMNKSQKTRGTHITTASRSLAWGLPLADGNVDNPLTLYLSIGHF